MQLPYERPVDLGALGKRVLVTVSTYGGEPRIDMRLQFFNERTRAWQHTKVSLVFPLAEVTTLEEIMGDVAKAYASDDFTYGSE